MRLDILKLSISSCSKGFVVVILKSPINIVRSYVSVQKDAVDDTDDPFKALDEDLTQLRQKEPTLVPAEITAVDIVDTYASVITTEIFAEFSEDDNMKDRDEICDDNEDEVVTKPYCRIYTFLAQNRNRNSRSFA